MTEIKEITESHHNFMDSHSPLNSWVGFLIADFLESEFFARYLIKDVPSETRARAAGVVHKIFDRQILSPLDKLIARIAEDEGEDFDIPLDQAQSVEAATKSMYAGASAAVFKYSNDFFPKGSWPWTAARESVFVLGDKGKYTGAEMKRIFDSDQTGPIGYLTIARLLEYIKHPSATDFAKRGLERLSAADFRKDTRLVLAGTNVLAEIVERLAAALRKLNGEEIEALAAVLPPETSDFIKESIRLLHDEQNKPVGEVLSPAIDGYWNDVLRDLVELHLSEQAAR